ncbi:MAG: hypothetical protein SGBAC_001801 [Bacillariaceae sp.]
MIHILDERMLQVDDKRWFEMDAILDEQCSQEKAYSKSGAQQAVSEDIFQGFNCTIIAYGQTGSGKSYTMGTIESNCTFETDNIGVIPRACSDLFQSIQKYCGGNARVKLSFLEIYNEDIRDLMESLGGRSLNSPRSNSTSKLVLRETLDGEVYVSGLASVSVENLGDVEQCMQQASRRRVTAYTHMNSESSRSHALCILHIQGVLEDGTKFASKLTFVDLAGSEKIRNTRAEGMRRQEGININKGLFVLGQVIGALAERRSKKNRRKPPYRDSKLTRLLQDSIGGNARTIMIACVSPDSSNVEETANTLRYATSARSIENVATSNIERDVSPEEVAKLERDNELLRKQVQHLRQTIESMVADAPEMASIPSLVESDEAKHILQQSSSSGTEPEDAEKESKSIEALANHIEKPEANLRQAALNGRKTAKGSVVEFPELKTQLEATKKELQEADELKNENESMHQQLLELKAEAESSTIAASKMHDLLLQELKEREDVCASLEQRETDKVKVLAKEGNSWSIFIVIVLFFQIFITVVGFSTMAFQRFSNSGLERKMTAVLESMETLSNTCNSMP